MHSTFSCFLRKRFPLFRYHTYDIIPSCKKDPSTSLGMTIRETLSKHIRCTLREINLFPPPSFRAQREIFLALCSFLLLSQKVSPFPLSHIRRYTGVQERSRASLGMTLRKQRFPNISFIRDVGYPFPDTVISSAARNLPCTLLFLASFAEGFPFSAVSHRTLRYTSVQERSRASLGMTLREYRSLTLPIYFPCNNDTREAPSTFAALLFFMRRTTPLNPTT